MKKGFRILDKLSMADTAFEAKGKDLNEVFEQSALAVESIMVDLKTVSGKVKTTIELEKASLETLLYEFLSELVYLKDAESAVYNKIHVAITKNKGWLLHAQMSGGTITKKMKLGTDIKAITLHEFELVQSKEGWSAQVVVDV